MRVLRFAVTVTVGLGLLIAAEGALGAPVKRVGTPVAIPREHVAGTYDHNLRSSTTLRRPEADTTPPNVDEAQPAAGAVDVPITFSVDVIFSEAMDRPATQAAFTVVNESNATPVAGRVAWLDDDTVLNFYPTNEFEPSTIYRVRLAGGRDRAGNALATQSWTFTTLGDGNLVGNPSFEMGTTGWGSYQGQLGRVALADAPDGGFVARAARASGTFYSVGDSESGFRPTVASTVAGATYIATGYVRAASASAVAKPVKITLRERNAANVTVREISTTATLGTGFTRLAVSADAAATGNTLGMRLEQSKAVAGDAFYADAMSLVRATPVIGDTAAGPGWTTMSANTKRVSVFGRTTPPIDIAKLRVYADGKAATSGSQSVRGLVYDDNDGKPGVLLRRTEQATIAAGRAAGWLDLKLTSPLRFDAYGVWLGLHSGPTVVARFAHTATPPGSLAFNSDAFSDGATDPFGTFKWDGKHMSIHAIGG